MTYSNEEPVSHTSIIAAPQQVAPQAPDPLDRILIQIGSLTDKVVLQGMRTIFVGPRNRRLKVLQRRIHHAHQVKRFYSQVPFLEDRDNFFHPPQILPDVRYRYRRRTKGGTIWDFRFPSGFSPVFTEYRMKYNSYKENQTVHGRLWQHDTPGRPTAICIHGWGCGYPAFEERVFNVPFLYRLGLNVLIYILPFHGARTPSSAGMSGRFFLSPNLARTNESFAQSIFELRTLMRLLRERGSGPIGAIGVSLGGYTTALLASVEPSLAFAIPIVPFASLADLLWEHGRYGTLERLLEKSSFTREDMKTTFAVHTPLAMTPKLKREDLFIIAGKGDRICLPSHAQALWEHWNTPRIHWFPGGHLAQFKRGAFLTEIQAFLEARGFISPGSP
ncbi:MAG: abhydrolase domain-containing 18 [Deltaproteobacteria bacterium]|nr:MAG: abhydrolase domain-containing 18 [Deltaproteobacteria bacterium]